MPRPAFSRMAVLALSSLATASAQPGGTECHPTPQETRIAVPWAGNAGDIAWSANRPDCQPEATGPGWVSVSVLPPVSGNPMARVLRYSVDSNFSPAKREGQIKIGDAAVTIEQAPGPAPGMAFSPSRFEFQFGPANGPLLEATKTLYVGSEEPLTFTATPDKAALWLHVKPAGPDDNNPRRQRAFEISVSAAGKDPGVYQADIVLESPGAANPKEIVSVTMTVGK